MNLAQLRSQFLVYLLLDQVEASSEVRLSLIAQGFQVEVFLDEDALLLQLRKQAPHFIVFHTRALPLGPEMFFKQVLNLNNEVCFIAITMPSNYDQLEPYYKFNLYEHIIESAHYVQQLVRACDRYVSFQSQTYLNETLYLENQKLKSTLTTQQQIQQSIEGELNAKKNSQPLQVLETYLNRPSGQSLVDLFFLRLSGLNAKAHAGEVFLLSYIDSTSSLLLTHIYNSSFNFSDQVTSWPQISELELQSWSQQKQLPQFIVKSLKVIDESISWSFSFLKLSSGGNCLLLWNPQLQSAIDFEVEWNSVQLVSQLEAKAQTETLSPLTSDVHFQNRYESEMARSLRLQMPVSLVNIQIGFGHAEDQWTVDMEAAFFQFMKKLLRTYDFFTRVSRQQYLLALPHCQVEDAFKLAERIRLSLEKHAQLKWGIKLMICQAVTGFPIFSNSLSEGLAQTDSLLKEMHHKGLSQTMVVRAQTENQKSEAESV